MPKQVYTSCKNCKYGFFNSIGEQRCGIGLNSLVNEACNWEPRDGTSGWTAETLKDDNNYITIELNPNIDAVDLHEALLTLPAEKYLELYSIMKLNMHFYKQPEDR